MKMSHKIFLAHKRQHRYEGTQKIAEKLKVALEREGFNITNKFEDADLYHIFSNGFMEAIQYKKIRDKAIYSLLTNIDPSKKQTFRFLKDAIKEKRKKNYIFQVGKVFASSLVPLSVKRKYIAIYRHITVPTQYLKETLGLKKVHVIPIGIDTQRFRKMGEGDGVAFFGGAASIKGYPDLYKTAKLIDRKVPIRFYFRGEERKMNKLIKGENVEVFGVQKDIIKAYNENSIVVLPFRSNVASIGIPLTLLETMACERAIITTSLPHIKEVAGDSVLYVDPYAPEQIKEKIEMLLDDDRLRWRLGKKARKRVLEHYTKKHMLDGFLRLYEEALD